MTNRLMTIGGIALLAVLGNSYATPALAQSIIRATPVKNIDEKGRSPYLQHQARSCPGDGNAVCDIVFPPVPAGKRLVLERVNAGIIFATSGVRIAGLLAPLDVLLFFRVQPTDSKVTSDSIFVVNEPTLVYFESGQTPIFHLVANNGSDVPVLTATISGYFVDIDQ
jgi:hypothetical protein